MSIDGASLLSTEFLSKYEGKRPENAGPLFDVVYLRTYSRWLESEGRRERWIETVKRVVDYSISLYSGPASVDSLRQEAEFMFDSVFNLRVLPAGRTLWVGGTKAARKWPESQMNCSFVVIDELEALWDLFHMLMCGSGVGFRVLSGDVAKLPHLRPGLSIRHITYKPILHGDSATKVRLEHTLKEIFINPQNLKTVLRITIGDSKEGWVESLKLFLLELAFGECEEIEFDYDYIRPQGERIKTFGGRAAGPQGLWDMYKDLEGIINRCGGHIDSIAALDICNAIALNVVVGGTRRSSQIALGSPEDDAFISAKVDLWSDADKSIVKKWRIMSNNSVAFDSKPSREEMVSIFQRIQSNGEPGFCNLEAMRKRRPWADGLNPCVTEDTWITTSDGPRQVRDLINKSFEAVVDGERYRSNGFWCTGRKPVFLLLTKEGYRIKLTKDHKVLTSQGFIPAGKLKPGCKIILSNNQESLLEWSGAGSRSEGWILGSMVGDGCLQDSLGYLRYWGDSRHEMATTAFDLVHQYIRHRSDLKVVDRGTYNQISRVGIRTLANQFGLHCGRKVFITRHIEKSSSDFQRGFLQGLFDADGSVQGSISKGRSIRLSQSNLPFLIGVQRMLSRFGVKSVVRPVREADQRELPDGKGGMRLYACKKSYELIINRQSMQLFHERIGFSEPEKKRRLERFLSNNKRNLYKDNMTVTFRKLKSCDDELVYDCTVENVHRFDANGMVVHNCAEILLASRGVCNLSTVVLTSFLDKENKRLRIKDLRRAFRLATRIGLRQTNIDMSLPRWSEVQKRDRLTGVSMTGVEDAFDFLGWENGGEAEKCLLSLLNEEANIEAAVYAKEMRIPAPLLVTALKPEGTLSQLPTVSSGLHRSYAPYFIRRIRVSAIDPVCKALQYLGVPNEPDKSKSDRIVFSFPIKTEAKISSAEESAVEQLKRYYMFQRCYTDHNSSCTLTFSPGEVDEVIDMVLDNWDDTIAVAFLPKYTSAYPQMPYEEISQSVYEEMASSFPDLSSLASIVDKFECGELMDDLEQDPSCAGGACPVR